MKNLKNNLINISLCAFSLLLFCAILLASFDANAQVTTKAKQAIILDYDTGAILFEKNPDEKMPTSSMSKVMSMYLVFEALKKGDLSLNDSFVVSEKAWKKGGSKMFVPLGKPVKVEDLIRGVIVQSGNDATIVLAEGLAGDEISFAAALNKKAHELGMNNSHFMNASGWPDPEHYSTARDLAILTKAIIDNFPKYYHYYAEKEFTYNNIRQTNRNPLLYKNIGADGLKTGHTEDGGYGLIGTGVKDGRRVIMVLNGMASKKERAEESTRLLQWGINGFSNISLFANDEILDRAPVYLGTKRDVKLKAKSAINITIPKLYKKDLKVSVEYNSPLKAPIAKGVEVGIVSVEIPKGEVIKIPLVSAEEVQELPLFAKLITKARLLSTGQGHFE